jgi:hypothetical protein
MPASLPNRLVMAEENYHIPLVWSGDSINSKWDPYAALLIPVRLENCPDEYYMQFDLGSPNTILYMDELKDISARYPSVGPFTNSTKKLVDFHFIAGGAKIIAKEIVVHKVKGPGIDKNKGAINIIGTFGGDLIENKIAIIDYPGRTLFLGASIPVHLQSKLMLTDFILAGRAILLPAVIKGNNTMLYFDTGSSTFELITDRATSLSLSSKDATPVKYEVNSWGNLMTANTLPSEDRVIIASQKIPLRHVTYFEGFSDSQVQHMMKTGMGGMTGNRLFLQFILVLDTRNKKFGIIMDEKTTNLQRGKKNGP